MAIIMKKIILILVLIMVISALYLFLAYTHIFAFIGAKSLVNPTAHTSITLSPPSSTSTTQITFVALGDSLTAGVGTTAEEETYPYLLAKFLVQKKNVKITLTVEVKQADYATWTQAISQVYP